MSGVGGPCTVSAKLSKFEHVREKGARAGPLYSREARALYRRGPRVLYGGTPPVKRQTDRHTQIYYLLATSLADGNNTESSYFECARLPETTTEPIIAKSQL